jgi:hypothetical protein
MTGLGYWSSPPGLASKVVLPELTALEAISWLLSRWRARFCLVTRDGLCRRQRALAHELAGALDSAPPAANCTDLGGQLNALGEDYLQRIRLADASYDQETNHGMTQGAIFLIEPSSLSRRGRPARS